MYIYVADGVVLGFVAGQVVRFIHMGALVCNSDTFRNSHAPPHTMVTPIAGTALDRTIQCKSHRVSVIQELHPC